MVYPKSRFDACSDIFISSQFHETENFNRKQNHQKRTAFECCDYYTNYSYKYPSCHFPQHENSNLFQAFILSIHILLYIHVSFIVAVGHCSVVIIGAMASQITSLTIVYSTVHSGAHQRKYKKLRVTGLCAVNSPMTNEFPAQRASNAENVFNWWRHHD